MRGRLTATLQDCVRVIEIRGLGERRGPPGEAQTLYAELLSPATAPPVEEGSGE